jgi:hypothetical protein
MCALLHGHTVSGYGRRVPRDVVVRGTVDSEIDAMTSRTIHTTGADILRIAIDFALRWLGEYAPRSRLINCVHDSLDLHMHSPNPNPAAAVSGKSGMPQPVSCAESV